MLAGTLIFCASLLGSAAQASRQVINGVAEGPPIGEVPRIRWPVVYDCMGQPVEMRDGAERCTGMSSSVTLHVHTIFDAQQALQGGDPNKGIAILTGRAIFGDALAAVVLADLYGDGRPDGSVQQDELRSLAWFRRAGELNHRESMEFYQEEVRTLSPFERTTAMGHYGDILMMLETWEHPSYEWVETEYARADDTPPPTWEPAPPPPPPAPPPQHTGPIPTTRDLSPIPTLGQPPDAADLPRAPATTESEECRCFKLGMADKTKGLEDWDPGTGRSDCDLTNNADHWYDGYYGKGELNPCR